MPKRRARTYDRSSQGWLRKHSTEIVVGIVTAIAVALLMGAGDKLYQFSRRLAVSLFSSAANKSHIDALAAARRVIGAHVSAAVPFRNQSDSQQYIAALVPKVGSDRSDSGVYAVQLMAGDDGAYVVRDVELRAYDPHENEKKLFGVVDVDGNGKKEVFTKWRSYGSAGYTFTVQLYDVGSNRLYSLTGTARYGDIEPILTEQEDLQRALAHRRWMLQEARRMRLRTIGQSMDDQPIDPLEMLETEWKSRNGRGFYTGKPFLPRVTGRVKTETTVICRVTEGGEEWTSYFHWGVTRFDAVRNVTELMWLPEVGNWDVDTIVIGRRYVWLGTTAGYKGLVAFDRPTSVYHIVALPSTAFAVPANDGNSFQSIDIVELDDVSLDVIDRDLHVGIGAGFLLRRFHPSIAASGEFISAKRCSRW